MDVWVSFKFISSSILAAMFLFSVFLALANKSLGAPGPATRFHIRDVVAENGTATSVLHHEGDYDGMRSLLNILWGCTVTIFTCTWVAVHPNIPGAQDSRLTRLSRRVVTMLCAVVMPECIAMWALQQRIAAKQIIAEYNAKMKSKQ